MSEEQVNDWDEIVITDDDEGGFELIPAGEYDFTVLGYTNGNHQGSAKLPACKKVVVKIRIEENGEPLGELEENLFCHMKMKGLLFCFFRSIGLKKHGEPLVIDWSAIAGLTGRCKVTTREWKKDNDTFQSNNVKFLDPEVAPVAEDTSFDPAKIEAEAEKKDNPWG
jgi:hypothetical protein